METKTKTDGNSNEIADMLNLGTENPQDQNEQGTEDESNDESQVSGDQGSTENPVMTEKDKILARRRQRELEDEADRKALAEIDHQEWLDATKDEFELWESIFNPLTDLRTEWMRELAVLDAYIADQLAEFPNPRAPHSPANVPSVPVSGTPGTPGSQNGQTSREGEWAGRDFGRRVPNQKGTEVWAADWVTELTSAQYELLKDRPQGKVELSHIQFIEAWSPKIAHIRAHGHTVHGEIAAREITKAMFGKTQTVVPIHWGTTRDAYLADPKAASAPIA